MPVENRIAISIVPRVVHLQRLEDVFLHQGAADQFNPGAKLSRALSNMTLAMRGQSNQMHSDDKTEFPQWSGQNRPYVVTSKPAMWPGT